jgi:hypothetical protein
MLWPLLGAPHCAKRASTPPDPPVGRVACGNQTCGPDEYCLVQCTCCGAFLPPEGKASASFTCTAVPNECRGHLCECSARPSGLCDESTRTVNTPCA